MNAIAAKKWAASTCSALNSTEWLRGEQFALQVVVSLPESPSHSAAQTRETHAEAPTTDIIFRRQPLKWLMWRVGQIHHPYRFVLLFVGILAPLGISAELAEDVVDKEELRYDSPILWWLYARRSAFSDHFWLSITEVGGFIGTTLAAIAVGVWLWRNQRRRALLFWALATLGAGAANVVIKLFFRRERPSLWQSISPESDSSFPSGHAMLSMSFALALLLLFWPTKWRRVAVVFWCVWPVLVGVSRLYLGVHYPSDVLVGWCAGIAWTSGVYVILRGERNTNFEREMENVESVEPVAPQKSNVAS